MKLEEDNCYFNGRHEFCKATYPGQYEWCSSTYHRCAECTDDAHCPPGRPYCDWDLECEECLVSAHCSSGESCVMRNGRWVCRVKDCVDWQSEGVPNYCADNLPGTPICDLDKRVCVECVYPSDCKMERETCIDSKCVDESEMDCMDQIAAGFSNYCEVTSPELPVCHTRLRTCVECEFDRNCGAMEPKSRTCVGTRCVEWDWECELPEDCISDAFTCVQHKCVKKLCNEYDDPDAYCQDRHGKGWRCFNRECVRCVLDTDCNNIHKICVHQKCVDKEKAEPECTEPDSEQFCLNKYGAGWDCKDGYCVEKEGIIIPVAGDCRPYLSSVNADAYCASVNPAKPHCDFDTGKCWECVSNEQPSHCPQLWTCWNHVCYECRELDGCPYGYKCSMAPDWSCVRIDCTDAENPDAWCGVMYGFGYTCVDAVCVMSDCDHEDARCPQGYYCPEHECIWGCDTNVNCPVERPHCSAENHCVECTGPVHCDDGYDCIEEACVKKEDCLRRDDLCPKNEYCNFDYCEEGCRDNKNCAELTPHCSQKTGKCEECVFDTHCERGYDCDDHKCVWVGFDCSYDPECPENWFCSDTNFCVFGCHLSADNCAKETPYCSQETGKCEECWSSVHCESWQECKVYRCVARKDNAECVPGDKKHGKRCRDGIWVNIECKGPEDCLGHEYCDDGLCWDKERECEIGPDCPSGYFCGTSYGTYKCIKQVCRTHDDCPVGQGCDYSVLARLTRDNDETKCFSWREYFCSDTDPCPDGWVCDRGCGQCREELCTDTDRPCQDDRYKCEDFHCVPKRCDDWEDPQAHCMDELGWYGRCVRGACTIQDCSWYPDPDLMCQETEGETWRCVDKRCIDYGSEEGGVDPDGHCVAKLGIDEAYWDYETRSCEVPSCETVADPDMFCAQLKDPRYKCRGWSSRSGPYWACRRGHEGQECADTTECVTGLRCGPSGLCIEKECVRWQDCNDPEKWCNRGVCEPLRSECEGPDDCREDYHCDAGGQCVPNSCEDHYDCGLGECCNEHKACVPCEQITCLYNFNCRRGWYCNRKTNKCQRKGCTVDSECENGFYCDLDLGECVKIEKSKSCEGNSDCPDGQICKGAEGTRWVQDKWPFGSLEKRVKGICVDPDVVVVRIDGIEDEKTCDYCRSMIGRVGLASQLNLPPYHNKCRCWATDSAD